MVVGIAHGIGRAALGGKCVQPATLRLPAQALHIFQRCLRPLRKPVVTSHHGCRFGVNKNLPGLNPQPLDRSLRRCPFRGQKFVKPAKRLVPARPGPQRQRRAVQPGFDPLGRRLKVQGAARRHVASAQGCDRVLSRFGGLAIFTRGDQHNVSGAHYHKIRHPDCRQQAGIAAQMAVIAINRQYLPVGGIAIAVARGNARQCVP